MCIHGGWWRNLVDLHRMDAICADLASRNWVACNIEYRRTGEGGGWPTTVADVLTAIAALATVGPAALAVPVVAIGHSAGGHLALMAGAEGAVGAVVALGPVTDPARSQGEGLGDGAAATFFGGNPDEKPDDYMAASPFARLPFGVPTLLCHGDLDDRVPVEHSRDFVARATALGDDSELVEQPGGDHFYVIDPAHPNWQVVLDWVGRRTKAPTA
jgi:acetyl esterase/lipase